MEITIRLTAEERLLAAIADIAEAVKALKGEPATTPAGEGYAFTAAAEPATAESATPEPAPAPQPAPVEIPASIKGAEPEEVRAAIEKCRERLLGHIEDADRKKMLNQKLNAYLKQLSVKVCDSNRWPERIDRPTQLPALFREAYIRELDEICFEGDTFTMRMPF